MGELGTRIIALAGKGGVGKTSLAACIVRLLAGEFPDKRVLAIDADPAVGLQTALGAQARLTIDDIRKSVADAAESGDAEGAVELLGEARCRIFDAISEEEAFSFVAVGRPEASGCYCAVNAYLREVVGTLAAHFDFVVIDGEAGIEQVNRRVMEKVTDLILVTDPSRKAARVIQTIRQVAGELGMCERVYAVANRIASRKARELLDTGGIPVLACIPDDAALAEADLEGRSVFELPDGSPVLQGAREALTNMGVLPAEGASTASQGEAA